MEIKIYFGLTYLITSHHIFVGTSSSKGSKKKQNPTHNSAVECWTITARKKTCQKNSFSFPFPRRSWSECCGTRRVPKTQLVSYTDSENKSNTGTQLWGFKEHKNPLSSLYLGLYLVAWQESNSPPPPTASACAGVRQLHSIWKPRSGKRKHNKFLHGHLLCWVFNCANPVQCSQCTHSNPGDHF